MTKFDDLEKLADLKKKGILTEEEFETQKKKLLETTESVQDEVSDENVDTSPLGRYVGCFKKYATFHGRASRSEFWWFFLFNFLAAIITDFIPFIGISPRNDVHVNEKNVWYEIVWRTIYDECEKLLSTASCPPS